MVTVVLLFLVLGTLSFAVYSAIKKPSAKDYKKGVLTKYIANEKVKNELAIGSSHLYNKDVEKILPVDYGMIETLMEYSAMKKVVNKANISLEEDVEIENSQLDSVEKPKPKEEDNSNKKDEELDPKLQVIVDDLGSESDLNGDGEMDSFSAGMPKFK